MTEPDRTRRRLLCTLAGAGAALLAPRIGRAAPNARQRVIAMVDAACTGIAAYGFPDVLHHTPIDTWRSADDTLYVFVIDRDGILHLHPDKRMEGRSVYFARDADGERFIASIIDTVPADGSGRWTTYMWPKPRTRDVAPKHTYFRAAGSYIAAAGYSD